MTTRPLFILSTAALASLALAAPATAAASAATETGSSAPLVQPRLLGLLDPILDPIIDPILGGGDGGTTTDPVDTSLVTTIVGDLLGTVPLGETALTEVVTELLGAGATGDSTVVGGLVESLLATSGGTLPVADLVAALLADGVSAELVPSVLAQVLTSAGAPTDLVTALVSGAVGELLVVGLPTDLTDLNAVLALLGGGSSLTGTLLAPVADVLDVVAANPVVPADLGATLTSLTTQIRSTGDALLSAELSGSLSGVLASLGSATSGTGNPISPVLTGLGTLVFAAAQPPAAPAPSTTTTTAPTYVFVPQQPTSPGTAPPRFRFTRDMRARVTRVRISRTRRTVKATLSCPKVAVLGCAVRARIRYRGRSVGRSKALIMHPGKKRTVSLRVPASRVKTVRRRGGRVYVRAVSYLGAMEPTASRSVRVKKVRGVTSRRRK